MQTKKQKAKSIAEAISINNEKAYELSLESFSYGVFKIGGDFSEYKGYMKEDPALYVDWDPKEKRYVAAKIEYEINLWFSKKDKLDTIAFYKHCYYRGNDLIGMSIFKFLSLINKEPNSVEIGWVPTKDDNHGQNQRSYVFYFPHSKAIILWTWRKRIKNIMIYDNW